MIGRITKDSQHDQSADKLTRVDLAVMSVLSLLFGLAVIVKGLIAG